jgi:hypothetical protein
MKKMGQLYFTEKAVYLEVGPVLTIGIFQCGPE